MLQISVFGCDCLSGKHTITARDRNIHIMIVLFRIELAVSVLIDKICRIHGCAVHFAADEDGVSFFKCRYAVDEDRGQAGFLDFVVVTARYGAAEFESIAVSVF